MKKVLVSILALAMMLSCFCTINVFADEITPTITAKNAAGEVVGTYSTIDTAANAAGVNGTVVLSEGRFDFNGRQTIAVEGITLEGAGKGLTTIATSSSYASGSLTNRKALLAITANNVTVKDLTIDGSVYGDTVDADADFNVVRINSGTGIVLNNIYVTGSPKSLISIGSGSNSATVTATDLDCQAEYKQVPKHTLTTSDPVYADIDITRGTFTLNSGVVNGFIRADSNGTFVNNVTQVAPKYYRLTQWFIIIRTVDVTTTMRHFVESYAELKSVEADDLDTFIDIVLDHTSTIQTMTNEAVSEDDILIRKFINMLDDVINVRPNETLSSCKTQLENALRGE